MTFFAGETLVLTRCELFKKEKLDYGPRDRLRPSIARAVEGKTLISPLSLIRLD